MHILEIIVYILRFYAATIADPCLCYEIFYGKTLLLLIQWLIHRHNVKYENGVCGCFCCFFGFNSKVKLTKKVECLIVQGADVFFEINKKLQFELSRGM